MSSANEKQIAGQHYRSSIQHWDYVVANGLDYFQGQITKYLTRWKQKNGITDLYKAQHFLEKYIEVIKAELEALEQQRAAAAMQGSDEPEKPAQEFEGEPTAEYVNQDR